MSGYSNWPHNWTVPAVPLAADGAQEFTKTAIQTDGSPRRGGYANRRAWRAALSHWRREHG